MLKNKQPQTLCAPFAVGVIIEIAGFDSYERMLLPVQKLWS